MKESYATKLCPKIVHISALFYHSLSIISASGRKLLKRKNSKSFFLTPSMTTCTVAINSSSKHLIALSTEDNSPPGPLPTSKATHHDHYPYSGALSWWGVVKTWAGFLEG